MKAEAEGGGGASAVERLEGNRGYIAKAAVLPEAERPTEGHFYFPFAPKKEASVAWRLDKGAGARAMQLPAPCDRL